MRQKGAKKMTQNMYNYSLILVSNLSVSSVFISIRFKEQRFNIYEFISLTQKGLENVQSGIDGSSTPPSSQELLPAHPSAFSMWTLFPQFKMAAFLFWARDWRKGTKKERESPSNGFLRSITRNHHWIVLIPSHLTQNLVMCHSQLQEELENAILILDRHGSC